MLSKTYKKNKFGFYSWEIKLDEIWRIDIHETNNSSHIIEIREFGFFKDTIHFSHISEDNFENTISVAFEKAYEFFLLQKNWNWTLEQRIRKENEIFSILRNYNRFK